jgi:hypothetical protein
MAALPVSVAGTTVPLAWLWSPRSRLLGQARDEVVPADTVLLLARSVPDRHRPGFDLAIAEYQHVGDLLLLGQADLVLHPAVGVVHLDPELLGPQERLELAGALDVTVRDRDDHGLHRRAPDRERAGEMLHQDADEPFERSVDRPVDGHWTLLLAVLVDVGQIEPFGQHDQIDLYRRGLPFATQGILDLDVDLRGIEGAVLGLEAVGPVHRVEGGLDLGLGLLPQRGISDALVGLGSERELRLEAEPAVDLVDLAEEGLDLVLQLVGPDVDVAVVLDEVADARKARERAGALVAVEPAEVGQFIGLRLKVCPSDSMTNMLSL